MWLYRLACALLRVFVIPFFGMRVVGSQNVPAEGAVIITANHRSNWDAVLVALATKRQVHFMAKAELFAFKPFGWLVEYVGSFPVHRDTSDIKAIKTALKYLREGECLGLFPEGKRVAEEDMGAFKDGVAMMALRSGAKVVPVYVAGERRFRGGIKAIVGHPLVLPEPEGSRATLEEIERGTALVRSALDALAGGTGS